MIRFRTTGMALLGTAALFALTAAPAHAAPGDVTTSCASVLTPAGFVDVSWGYSSSCGTQSFSPNIKQIKQLTGLPVGTVVQACASTYQPMRLDPDPVVLHQQLRLLVEPQLQQQRMDPEARLLTRRLT